MPLDVMAPRQNTTQQANYIRRRVNFNSTYVGTTAGMLLGVLPVGAIITKVAVDVVTAFNAGTTNTLTAGTTATNANELIASGDVTATAVGYTEGTRGRGSSLTQAASPPTTFAGSTVDQTEGGVGVWAKFAQTGTAATAGAANVLVEFLPPNDA